MTDVIVYDATDVNGHPFAGHAEPARTDWDGNPER